LTHYNTASVTLFKKPLILPHTDDFALSFFHGRNASANACCPLVLIGLIRSQLKIKRHLKLCTWNIG